MMDNARAMGDNRVLAMSTETYDRVRAILAEYLDIPADKIEPDAKLQDLGADSLGALEIIFRLEESFQIVVPNERATEFTTVRAICDGIESLRQAPAPAK